jgi:predicted RNA-binding protein with PIN domain
MQLLGLPNVVVLVDGYNVSMSGWRHLQGPEQRHALISGVSDLTARTGADFRIVFDGDSDGARPTVSVASPVRIYFTAASEEADDAILRMITEVPDNQPIVVVSSDHRVQDGARRRGANVVASADLLAAIRH